MTQLVSDYEAGLRATVTQVRVLLNTFNAPAPTTTTDEKAAAAATGRRLMKAKGKAAATGKEMEEEEVASLAEKESNFVAALSQEEKQGGEEEDKASTKKEATAVKAVAVEEDVAVGGGKKATGLAAVAADAAKKAAATTADAGFTGSDCVVFRTAAATSVPQNLQVPAAAAELRARLNEAVVRVGAELNVPVYQWSDNVDQYLAADSETAGSLGRGRAGGVGSDGVVRGGKGRRVASRGGAAAGDLGEGMEIVTGIGSYLTDGHHQAYEASMGHVALFKKFVEENLPAHCRIA